jgi:hypothetical protein
VEEVVRPSAPVSICLAAALLPAASVRAGAPAEEIPFREHVRQRVFAGELTFDEGLLARFQRVFAPQDLPGSLRSPAPWPARSATMLVHEYRQLRPSLAPIVAASIDAYLAPGSVASAQVLQTAHFRFTFSTQGPDAVPAEDVQPADGVPDFVQRVAGYAETAWTRLVGEAGFTAPTTPGVPLDVSFREMAAFGYTEDVGGALRIVLHRSFAGFPANHDPEGSVAGAAKVTAAHELKHASQWATSRWTEGGWLEADAMWAEDFVFDAVDDYLRYLPFGSPVSHPDSWLANGGASYEDCLWQRYLTETYGTQVLVDFFAERAVRPALPVPDSFDAVLRARGASLDGAAAGLGQWSYFCGANAWSRPFGFEEADAYPTPPLSASLAGSERTLARSLSGMGTHYVHVAGGGRSGPPWIQFLGHPDTPFRVSAAVIDAAGTRTVRAVPLTASNTSSYELPVEWKDVSLLVLILTNGDTPRTASDYFLTVDDRNPVGVGVLEDGAFALHPNRPNPFRRTTTIAFSLPTAAPVRLTIYDVAGRLVRRLVEGGRMDAGAHERTWDGADEGGRAAAPGVYYYRLETDRQQATRKMLLLR